MVTPTQYVPSILIITVSLQKFWNLCAAARGWCQASAVIEQKKKNGQKMK